MILVVLLFYVIFTVWLIRRLKDIKKNPRKYDIIPGFEKYKKSEWYWPPKKEYSKTDMPDSSGLAVVIPLIVFMALFLVSLAYFPDWSRRFLLQGKPTVCFYMSTWGAALAMLTLCAYSVALSDYSIMFSKRPIAICNNLHQIFRKDDRSVAWRKMTTIVLVITIISCPLHLLCLASTGYADSEKIVYRPYLALQERTLFYDDVQSVERIYDEKGREEHCYLAYKNGETFDIQDICCFTCKSEEIEKIVFSYLPSECDTKSIYQDAGT